MGVAFQWLDESVAGEPEVAIDYVSRAMRLSPNDPHRFSMYGALAMAHFLAGRYAEAITFAEAAKREQPASYFHMRFAASEACLDNSEQRRPPPRLRELHPTLRISNLQSLMVLRRPEDIARWEEGMRLAGLPE